MPETVPIIALNLDYYDYCATGNFVFEEQKPLIQNGYTYEENGVYYCTSATQKGVYCYTYARNNPLIYTDPDGEWIHLVIGAVIGGIMNLMMNAQHLDKGWKGFGQAMAYFGIGAAAGALSAGIGAGVSTAIAGAGFSAGFIGTSTATVTGFLGSAAVAGSAAAAGSFITGAGNSWMQGNSFGKGLWDGTKASLINGTTAAITAGIFGGIDAAMNGRNFWTGDYKQYKLQLSQIASTDNGTIYEQYITPPGKPTIQNEDQYRVYYRPEDGKYGIRNYTEPGGYHYGPIDGVATSKHNNLVFKVPDGGRVKILFGGDVEFLNPTFARASAGLANINSLLTAGKVYEYGWMPLSKLDRGWEQLFIWALTIK